MAGEQLPAELAEIALPTGSWDIELTELEGPLAEFAQYPGDEEITACVVVLQERVRTLMEERTGQAWLIKVGEGSDWETSVRLLRRVLSDLVEEVVIERLRPMERLQDAVDPPTPDDVLSRLISGAWPPRAPGRPPPFALLLLPSTRSSLAQEGQQRGIELLATADPDHISLVYLQHYPIPPSGRPNLPIM